MSVLLKLKYLLPRCRRAIEQDKREELESLAALSDADGARADLGSLPYVAEAGRTVWTWTSVEAIAQDFRHALYALRRRPSLTVVTILTVGLAVGASTAIFSIVNAILIQPPPYHDANRLAMLWNLNERVGYTFDDVTSRRGESMSPAEFLEWKTNASIFDGVAAFDTRDYPNHRHGSAGDGARLRPCGGQLPNSRHPTFVRTTSHAGGRAQHDKPCHPAPLRLLEACIRRRSCSNRTDDAV